MLSACNVNEGGMASHAGDFSIGGTSMNKKFRAPSSYSSCSRLKSFFCTCSIPSSESKILKTGFEQSDMGRSWCLKASRAIVDPDPSHWWVIGTQVGSWARSSYAPNSALLLFHGAQSGCFPTWGRNRFLTWFPRARTSSPPTA